MRTMFMSLFMLLSFNFAQAANEILVCAFTEPFFTVTYNATTKEVTYTGMDMYDELSEEFMVLTLATNAKFEAVPQIDVNGEEYVYPTAGSQFKLLDDKGDLLVDLTLSYLGSDGMSDFIYPFDAVHASGHVGGCYSTTAPLIDPNEIFENLK